MDKLTYDEARGELEQILTRLRSGKSSIDDLASEVKRATELIELCRKRLLHSEEELKKIFE